MSLIGIMLGAAGGVPTRAQSPVPKSDVQFWNDTQLAVPLGPKVDFVLQTTLRLRSDVTSAVDGRWGVGWVFKPNKYLSFNSFYFHREGKPPNGRRETEERLTLGATVRFPVGKFTVSQRNWFERRWRQPQVDSWRYRNAVLIEHPFTIRKKKFTLAMGDEVFYDWSLRDWVRNRVAVGASHAFNKHFTLYLYVMRQNDGRARPGDITILGSQMRFRM